MEKRRGPDNALKLNVLWMGCIDAPNKGNIEILSNFRGTSRVAGPVALNEVFGAAREPSFIELK